MLLHHRFPSHRLGHDKRRTVVSAQKHVRVITVVAYEPLALGVECQHRTDGHAVGVEIDFIRPQMLQEAVKRLGQQIIVFDGLLHLLDWSSLRESIGNVGRVNHTGGDVALENVCFQIARTLTTLMAPFVPATAAKCAKMLRLDDGYTMWASATSELPAGHALDAAAILVKKLDAKELFGD